MATIKEFKGLRPARELAHLVSELPYDVVDSNEAREIAKKNEKSFFKIIKPEVDFPDDIDAHDDIVYQTGKKNLSDFQNKGILKIDSSPSLYIYTLIMNGHEQTGLVACVSIDDYLNNIIKKHELTLEAKELDRARHIDTLNAQTGPVFLLYKEDGNKRNLFEKAMKIDPEYDFTTDDGVRHIFRVISDKELINSFKSGFNSEIFYIADGHHRTASAVRVCLDRREKNSSYKDDEEYNWFMAVIFPHEQLKIMAYNRVVQDLNNLSQGEFFNRLSEDFTVENTNNSKPERKRTFNMYLEGKWYRLTPRFEINSDIENLDVNILQKTILDPILGIKEPRKDSRIDFIGGIKGTAKLEQLVNSGKFKLAFSMFPTAIEELIILSDAGKIMPPKSTWFEPKLRSGLVTHLL